MQLHPAVKYHFSQRQGGKSQPPFASNNFGLHVGDDPQAVQANRQAMQTQFQLKQIQWLEQIHGDVVVQAPCAELAPLADALFTREPNTGCAILTADCLPVLFAAKDGSQVAAAHAGWRGLAAGVLLNTLHTFAQPSQVQVLFGPAIGPSAFEVGPEVRDAFAWASAACFVTGQGDRWYANLYRLAYEQLYQAGVREFLPEQGLSQACTWTETEKYFSYRREGKTGRMASLIWLDNQ